MQQKQLKLLRNSSFSDINTYMLFFLKAHWAKKKNLSCRHIACSLPVIGAGVCHRSSHHAIRLIVDNDCQPTINREGPVTYSNQ